MHRDRGRASTVGLTIARRLNRRLIKRLIVSVADEEGATLQNMRQRRPQRDDLSGATGTNSYDCSWGAIRLPSSFHHPQFRARHVGWPRRPIEVRQIHAAPFVPPRVALPVRAVGRELPQYIVNRRVGSELLCQTREPIRPAAFAEAARNAHDDVRKCGQGVHPDDKNKTGTKNQATGGGVPRQVATCRE